MVDAFFLGKDFHLSTAKDFLKCDIPEEALYETSEQYEQYKKKFKTERDKSKIINFSIAYGKGSQGFSKDFGITEDQAQELLDRYYATYASVKRAIDDCHEVVRQTGEVATIFGRKRRFVQVEKDGNKFYTRAMLREAFNHLVQGASADMMRLAGIACYKLKKENPQWNLKFLASVHDEIVFSVRKAHAQEAAAKIKQAFETSVKLSVPVVSSTSIGQNYGELK